MWWKSLEAVISTVVPGEQAAQVRSQYRAPDSIENHFHAAPGSRICLERVTIPAAQVKPHRMKIE
jgi:hypothetical protein